MKTLIATILLAVAALTVLTISADAKGRGRHYAGYYVVYVEKPAQYPPRSARLETHDDIRAKSYDPTGQYAAYPSWARAALGRSDRR
jgi:hypothetical protein